MTPPVASPCISLCVMDTPSGWCSGCLRTLDEIAAWSLLDEAQKRQLLRQISQRRVVWRRQQSAAAGLHPPGTPCNG